MKIIVSCSLGETAKVMLDADFDDLLANFLQGLHSHSASLTHLQVDQAEGFNATPFNMQYTVTIQE